MGAFHTARMASPMYSISVPLLQNTTEGADVYLDFEKSKKLREKLVEKSKSISHKIIYPLKVIQNGAPTCP